MYSVSSSFLPALSSSHTVVLGCKLLQANGQLVDLTMKPGGSVRLDRTQAATRGQMALSVVDAAGSLVSSGALAMGAYLYPYRGILYSSGVTETVPLGTYRITQPQVSEQNGEVVAQLQAYDLSRSVAFRGLTDAFQVLANTDVALSIRTVIEKQAKDLTRGYLNSTVSGTSTTQTAAVGTDPWTFATTLAKSVGAELYFDRTGVLTMKPANLTTARTVWDGALVEGSTCVMTSIQITSSDEGAASHVVVVGQHSAYGWVKGEAFDTNPKSPTYYKGSFGDVQVVISDSAVTSASGAVARANLELISRVGGNQRVQISCVPNPAIDPGDIVQVQRAQLGVQDLYYVDQVTIPLDLSQMTIVGRKVG